MLFVDFVRFGSPKVSTSAKVTLSPPMAAAVMVLYIYLNIVQRPSNNKYRKAQIIHSLNENGSLQR